MKNTFWDNNKRFFEKGLVKTQAQHFMMLKQASYFKTYKHF